MGIKLAWTRSALTLEARMTVPDPSSGAEVRIGASRSLASDIPSLAFTASGVLACVCALVTELLAHEVRESLALDGTRPLDPHAPVLPPSARAWPREP